MIWQSRYINKYLLYIICFVLLSCGGENSNLPNDEVNLNVDSLASVWKQDSLIIFSSKEDASASDTLFNKDYSQEEAKLVQDTIVSLCKSMKLMTLFNGLESFQLRSVDPDSVSYQVALSDGRTIVNDFKEYELTFSVIKMLEKDPLVEFPYRFLINIICLKDQIVEFKVTNYFHIKLNKNWQERTVQLDIRDNQNIQLVQELRTQYSSEYNKLYSGIPILGSNVVYGSHCGIGGTQPSYRKSQETLIAMRDLKNLKRWLKSEIVEIQLYGIDGLLTLRDEGMTLDKQTIRLIHTIGTKEGMATTCSGCSYSNRSIKELVVQIKKDHKAL